MEFNPLYRYPQLYGRSGIFPVSKSKFFADYLEHPGKPELIPGTNVKRLKTLPLGEQARAVSGVEVKRVYEGLCAEGVVDEPAPAVGPRQHSRRARR